MPDRHELILRRLQDEGQKTAAYFGSLREPDFAQTVYTTGPGWRVREVLAHFVSAERMFLRFGRDLLAGGQGAPEDFAIDDFNALEVAGLTHTPPAELLEQFAAGRAALVGMVCDMQEADFDRIGFHPWFGRVPVEQMLKLIYRHTMLHERDVRKALDTGQPVPHVPSQPPSARTV
jgi:uncharacterized protein (TIGR03083 family)